MVKVTVEDQVVSDFKEYVILTNKVLEEIDRKNIPILTISDYFHLLTLVIDHTHWVIESYPVASDQQAVEVTKAV